MNISQTEVKNLFKNSTYPFLGADQNTWIDANGTVLTLGNMEKEYLRNCYRYLKERKEDIFRGFFLSEFDINKNLHAQVRKIAKDLFNNKLRELENYLKY